PIDYTATIGGWDETSFVQLKKRAAEQLRSDAQANIDPAVTCDAIVQVATPVDGILTTARQSGSGMIVMGTHGRTGFRRLIIGSVTEAVMRKAEVPVIAVPLSCQSNPVIRTILCPAIYDDQYHDALTFASAIAPADAKFIVIRAATSDDELLTTGDFIGLRAWVPESIALRSELKILGGGNVAGQIEGYAEKVGADLIVAAEPAGRSTSDMLHGTFAARVVQHSHCPVLTMKRPAAKRAAGVVEPEHRTDRVLVTQ
ncbi:MAG TPA: universal stress protein, partial [Thermoanaerobaculia bacterium]|nr:universal stress protein [Thermoanaerobaculia bacterium]